VPLLYTVHHTYDQQCRYIKSQKWKRLLYLWERAGNRRADYLMCYSASTEGIIRRRYGVSPDRCETIPIGVDKERFYPLNIEREAHSLLFLGRLESRKGVDFLIRAIPGIKNILKDMRLYIVGEGVLRLSLEDFARRQGLMENVRFLGTLPDLEVNRWYNRVSAVIIPSVFEGFGLTATEAMACGTPVIATDVDGLRDVVQNGWNGLLVRYGHMEGIREKIIHLLTNPDVQRDLSMNGRKTVEEHYNWSILADRVWRVYERFLGGGDRH
jgi:glycosyltransferase involved in cell wall biosynthesis